LARIYTKTGDDGTTGLIGGVRVSKDSPRIEAYGTVDELNTILGIVRSYSLPDHLDKIIGRVQDELFTVGAELALAPGENRAERGILPLNEESVRALEDDIDKCQGDLKPLSRFILPGGAPAAAVLHFARAVARRAERCSVRLARLEKVDPIIIRYLNRLSDLCFVLARSVNRLGSRPESHPNFGRR